MPTLIRKKLRVIYVPPTFGHLYNKWDLDMKHIQLQLTQLRVTFEKAAFLLTKRDFDLLAMLEYSQFALQQKIDLFFMHAKHWPEQSQVFRKKRLESSAKNIESELLAVMRKLSEFKRTKFAKPNKRMDCL